MPDYSTDGTENLRASPSVKHGTVNEAPSGAGKDMGGTENLRADAKVMSNEGKSAPESGKDNRPAAVQRFDGGV